MTKTVASHWSVRMLKTAAWLVVGMMVLDHVYWSLWVVSPFDCVPFDGPFQLFNGLRRIDAGQVPGRDFQLFHGLGMPYLHYPLYKLFGSTIVASELSRQLIARLGTIAVLLLAARGLCGSALVALPWCWVMVQFEQWVVIFPPGGSNLGVRTLCPILLLTALASNLRPRLKLAAVSCVLIAAPLISTEHGLALWVACALTCAAAKAMAWRSPLPPIAAALARGLGVAVIALPLIVLGMCGFSGAGRALRYYFVEIPTDQMWYFGAPPNHFFLGGPLTSSDWLFMALGVFVIAALAIALVRWRKSTGGDPRVRVLCILGFLYAAISMVSYLGIGGPPNLFPAARVLMILGTCWLCRVVRWGRIGAYLKGGGVVMRVVAVATMIVVLSNLHAMGVDFASLKPIGLTLVSDKEVELTWRLAEEAASKSGTSPVLWSTYAGQAEARKGVFQPEEDYIIHALGPERRARYLQRFGEVQPSLVQTPQRSFVYEEWVQNTTWPFYAELLANYEVAGRTRFTLLWKRVPQPWVMPETGGAGAQVLRLEGSRATVPVPAAPQRGPQLYVVRVQYKIHNALGRLPIIGKLPRYMVTPEGALTTVPVSLPPNMDSLEFPVVAEAGRAFALRFATAGPSLGASLEVESVTVRPVTLNGPNTAFIEEVTPWVPNVGR